MQTPNVVRFWVATCAAALIGLFAGRALLAAPAETSPVRPPLMIAKEGYLYAGGHYDQAHADHHIVGQLYVDFQIPANRKYPYPIVMVHGGSQTGTDFWATPDGREGWAQFFLRRGYSVYVVDQVGRGKSPYVPEAYGPMVSQSLDYTRQKFTSPERFNLWPQSHLHTQWPGTGEQGDVAFDQYFASSAPSMDNRKAQAQMNVDALAGLLDRIGPAIILVHSQSGGYAWPLAQLRPALVKAIVAAEPAGPPVHDVVVRSVQRFDVTFEKALKQNEQDYFRDNPRVKKYGLTEIPLSYVPAVTDQSPLEFVQQGKSESPDLARCWRQKTPARQLVAVGDRPILVLGAEASFYAGYNHCNVEYLQQAGAHPDFIKLADLGIHGNGHMMMLEKNSDRIAQVIADWLDSKVPPLAH